jgi:hypothetical protein
MNCREMSANKIPGIRTILPSLAGLNINTVKPIGAGKDPASAASGDKRSFPSSFTTTPQQEAERLIERANQVLEAGYVDLAELNNITAEIFDFITEVGNSVRTYTLNSLRRALRDLTQAQVLLDRGATQPDPNMMESQTESEVQSQESEMDEPQPTQPRFDSGGASESQNPIPVPEDEPMGGGGESQVMASQYADLIEEEEEPSQQPSQLPGPSQLSQMNFEDQEVGGMRRADRLRRFKVEVVAVLREHAASTGHLTSSLRKQMQRLLDQLQPFRKEAKIADLMARALERVLEADATGPSSSTTNPPRNSFQKRIVGRATDVVNGIERHSFLLQTAANSFMWRDEPYMRRDPETGAILNAHLASNLLEDPSGNGWVKEIVTAVGAAALRIYTVKWTIDADVEPSVPEHLAQEDFLKSQLVPGAQRLAKEFDAKEEDADLEELDASGADGNVLQWDPGSGRPKLSLRRAVAAHMQDPEDPLWSVQALKEYTLNRIIALQSYLPPPSGDLNAPTREQLDQLGEDLYVINSKALDAAFERQRVFERREAGQTGDEPATSKAVALDQWRRDRKIELRDETIARWNRRRQKTQPELDLLNGYLSALKLVEEAGGLPSSVDTTTLTNQYEASLITGWQTTGVAWPGQLANPPCRLPRIRNFLSTPGRSEEAKGWLHLQRDIHSMAPDKTNDVFGSAYGPNWPANPTATNTPPDHVVPQRWFEGGTKLILECGDPGQVPAVALCKLAENSAKGDSALMLFSNSDDVEAASAGQGAYSPTDVSEAKKRMLAKHAAWVWALYPLISDQKRSIGITSYDSSTGCAWWSRAWQSGTFQSQVDAPATDFEKRIHLLSLGIRSWRVANPMVFTPGYMIQDMKDYIGSRFSGTDALPKLVDSALRRSVARAPT